MTRYRVCPTCMSPPPHPPPPHPVDSFNLCRSQLPLQHVCDTHFSTLTSNNCRRWRWPWWCFFLFVCLFFFTLLFECSKKVEADLSGSERRRGWFTRSRRSRKATDLTVDQSAISFPSFFFFFFFFFSKYRHMLRARLALRIRKGLSPLSLLIRHDLKHVRERKTHAQFHAVPPSAAHMSTLFVWMYSGQTHKRKRHWERFFFFFFFFSTLQLRSSSIYCL